MSLQLKLFRIAVVFFWFGISASQVNFSSNYAGKSLMAFPGSSVNFKWIFSGNFRFIKWGFMSSSVQSQIVNDVLVTIRKSDGSVVLSVPSSYSGRVNGSWDGLTSPGQVIFTLSSIEIQDDRLFGCQINPASLSDSIVIDTVELVVVEAPQISLSKVQASYNEGTSININCTASGKPEPYVKWIGKGEVKSAGAATALLTFNNVTRADHGQYTCKANNTAGNDTKGVALVVHYKPEGTTLTTNAAANTVTQGDSVTLKCNVKEAKPQVSQYRFYLNDTLDQDIKNSQYTINNVTRSQHYGKYKCVPRNNVGDGPGATVTLNVNIPVQFTVLPQNVTVNETNPIDMSCDASGFPTPSLNWTKNGEVVSHLKQLNIQRSSRSDAGMYVCSASNGVGQDKTAKACVTVQYPPRIKQASTSANKSWIGQTVTLTCVSDGVPTPTLTWYKPDGSQINSVTATQFTVNVKMEMDHDFGCYKCDADNKLTPADYKILKIEQIREPGSPIITSSASDIQATSLTVKWTAPADDGRSPITAYRVVILKSGTEIKNENITDPGTTSLPVGGLERDTKYNMKVFARNAIFEGPAGEITVQTKYEGVPAAATIEDLPSEVRDDTITLKWSEPDNNGRVITQYTVYQRIVTDGKTGEWTKLKRITDILVRELEVELKRGKVYEFVVTATNKLGESLKEDEKIVRVVAKQKSEGGGDTQTDGGEKDGGLGAAIYAGAAVAGVLLIIGIIIIIVLWRRRKPSSHDETSADELGSGNPYEIEDGYQSVSREAAQSLQASGPVAEPNYAQVDQSKKKKNRRPPPDEYAQVDKSQKTKKAPKKKPGELEYADLDDLRSDFQLAPVPAGATAGPIVRPPAYEGTEYADIAQFGVPPPEPTYANVSKKDVVYSNVESM